jgi:hypothetical protein
VTERKTYYHDYGTEGEVGGDGGKGGYGGYDGLPGEFILINKIGSFPQLLTKTDSFQNTNHGDSGNPGEGGQYGDTLEKVYIYVPSSFVAAPTGASSSIPGKNGFDDEYEKLIPSYKPRAKSGSRRSDKNRIGMIVPQKDEINIEEKKREYLKLIYKISTRFEYNQLLKDNSNFLKNTIDTAYLDSDLISLIERVEILSKKGFKNIHYSYLIGEQNKINKYFQNKELNEKEKLIKNFIKATICSLIMRYNSAHEQVLVVNLEKYLKTTLTQIKNWKTLVKRKEINMYKESYEMNLKNKIKEAMDIIDILQKDIQTNENQLNKHIAFILAEIMVLKKQVQDEDSRLVKKKEDLTNAIKLKTLFSVLQISTNIMSFFGPKGALIGSVIQAGVNSISQSVNEKNFNPNLLSPVVDIAIKNYQDFLKIKNADQLDKLEHDLKVLENEKNLKNNKKISLESRLEKLPHSFKKFKLKKEYAQNKQASGSSEADKKKYENLIKEAENELDKFKKKLSDSDKAFNAINTGIDLTQKCLNLATEIEIGSEEIKIVENEMKKNSERFNELYLIEKTMDEMQNTFFKEINKEINLFNTNLYNNSNSLLDFKRWQIKDRLNEIKDQIFTLTNAFIGHKKVSNTISRIENAILKMIDIHIRIESFEQQNEFANYMTDIIQNKDLTFKNLPLEYQKKLDSLEKIYHENIIEERFQLAVEAFKYWSFPFYCEYTLAATSMNDDRNDIDLKVNNYENYLEKLLFHVQTDNAEIKASIDNHVIYRLFDTNIPFFQWSSKTHPYELKRLLNGKLTTLYADINYAKFDAIKFCTLDILIEIHTPNTNKTLNDLLKNFMVEMTHSGESNFKYKGKTKTININYQLEEKLLLIHQYGSTENANLSFKKLAANKPMLSPYTFWTIQIKAIQKENEENLLNQIDLLIHENVEIKIFLHGQGQYVDESKKNSCE